MTGARELHLLTMEAGDIRNVQGALRFVAQTCREFDDLAPPPGVVIGVFPIDDGAYEIYSTIIDHPNPEKVVRLETSDFVSYSEPETVLTPPDGVGWMGPIFAESVVRKPDGSEYLLKARGAWKPWHGQFFFKSSDGRHWEPCNDLKPGYVDHDAGFLFGNSPCSISSTEW